MIKHYKGVSAVRGNQCACDSQDEEVDRSLSLSLCVCVCVQGKNESVDLLDSTVAPARLQALLKLDPDAALKNFPFVTNADLVKVGQKRQKR